MLVFASFFYFFWSIFGTFPLVHGFSRLVPDWFPTGSRLVPDWFPTGSRPVPNLPKAVPKFATWQMGSNFGQNLTFFVPVNAGMSNLLEKGKCLEGNPLGKVMTSPPPCFSGNLMETLKKFHQKFRTQKNWFSAPSFPQIIDFWHQKKCFPTPCFFFRAPASRCTKNGPDPPLHQVCTSREESCTNYPPLHQNWPNVLSQPGAGQDR